MLFLKHQLLYYLFRHVARHLPTPCLACLWRVISWPAGVARALRDGQHLSRILQICGRPSSFQDRIRLGVAITYQSLRHLDFYIYEHTPRLREVWTDGPPEREPCIYIMCNMLGSEAVGAFLDRHPGVILRKLFGGEGEIEPATVSRKQKWVAHQAALRVAGSKDRTVVVGENPMKYRSLLRNRRSIIIFQDVWDESDDPPHTQFLRQATSLRLGALRLSKLASELPLRFMSIAPQGGSWVATVSPRLPLSEKAIFTRVEAEILARPEAWMRWPHFIDYVDRKRAGSSPHLDTVDDIEPAPSSPHPAR